MARTAAERRSFKAEQRSLRAKRQTKEKEEREAIEEARQEAIAPAIQRHAVLSRSGATLRAARIRADGPAFARSSPLVHLALKSPIITTGHVLAAARLQQAWEEGGAGVGMGASNYGERLGGGIAKSGISDAILASIGRQNDARDECCAAQWFVGRAWPILRGIVIDGMDTRAWADQCRPQISPQIAVDRLADALNRLVQFYAEIQRPAPASKIRAVEIYAHAENTENTSPKPAQTMDLNENLA